MKCISNHKVASITACILALSSIVSCGPSRPSGPVSLNQLSTVFSGYPDCDSGIPACMVSQNDFEKKSIEEANAILSSGVMTPFVIRIDKINQTSNGNWDIDGKVAWDANKENAKLSVGLGLIVGLSGLIGGESVVNSVNSAASVGSSFNKQIGNCLTSTIDENPPTSEIEVSLKNVQIVVLEGIEEGSYALITATRIQDFKPSTGLLDNPASRFFPPSGKDFGAISLAGKEGLASAEDKKYEPREFCKEKNKAGK